MADRSQPYSDIVDLIEDSLAELARRRAKYPGDDLTAIRLLADLADEASTALGERVAAAQAAGAEWARIAAVLGASVTDVRLEFENRP